MKKIALIFRKTIFLSMVLFLFFVVTNFAKASETNYDLEFSKECSLRNCTVPVPTLDKPNNQTFYFDEKFYLTGLTWNDTEIDIYVNGKYKGSATVVNDENSDIANFYFSVDEKTLSKGDQNWEVIAWSKNRYDRSFVSQKNKFEIQLRPASIVNPILDNKIPEIIPESEIISDDSTSVAETDNSDSNNINVEIVESVDTETSSSTNVTIVGDEIPGNVVVNTATSSDGSVNIIESDESNKDISAISEKQEIDNTDSETIQPATPSEVEKDIVKDDLDLSNNQTKNKKLGIFLLFVLVVVVIFTTVVTKKKKD
ncbi:MAG: hypothetical protein PHZ07_00120 [Patescibacteria group bacterium]|nr:hypothetical protein [Patescibacteria group bacterium]MDD4304139.1 hypothetical protein [Patescibacteria group bacterium]MDD4695170.1 hypothetical protein [Patescibacteria group bacterium]